LNRINKNNEKWRNKSNLDYIKNATQKMATIKPTQLRDESRSISAERSYTN